MTAIFKRRSVLVALNLVLVAAVGLGSVAYANQEFSDVPPGSFFDDPVTAMSDAGCYRGFNDGSFRPNAAPTRGQFAFWLHNCAGRSAYAGTLPSGTVPVTGNGTSAELARFSITGGGLDGKGSFVQLNAAASVYSVDCNHCEYRLDIVADPDGEAIVLQNFFLETNFAASAGINTDDDDSGAALGAGALSGTIQFALVLTLADPDATGGTVNVQAQLSGVTTPLDGTGNGYGVVEASPSPATETSTGATIVPLSAPAPAR